MKGHQDPVGREVGIGLQVAEAECHGMLEGRHGVLGGLAGPAPVGEGERTRPVEEGVGDVGGHGGRVDLPHPPLHTLPSTLPTPREPATSSA